MKKTSLLRKLFAGFSLTSVMFVFQACYGTPQDFTMTGFIEGVVTDENGSPLPNISIYLNNLKVDKTERQGNFVIQSEIGSKVSIKFKDLESNRYLDKDTTFQVALKQQQVFIKLNRK